MHDNAVLRLREARLARSTRPFLARGNKVRRCQRCLLALTQCLCDTLVTAPSRSQFSLLMYDTEPLKPSNTGRLIADILPGTTAFQWSRTEPPEPLLSLISSGDWQPMVVFPASDTGESRKVYHRPPTTGKPLLFIMLDGTWSEARKMFRKSPWLDTLPVISVDLNATSAYQLRESHGEGQYCTAEVAIALLELSGDVVASRQLTRHFTLFRERYLAGKAHHSHKVTAKLEESI